MSRLFVAQQGVKPTPTEMLERFIDWAAASSLTLYPAQEEALLELAAGKHVVLSTPTGSGKSLVALFLHALSLSQEQRSFYTCPIKALVNEKFFALCEALGPENVGMMTGDAAINRDAPVIACTAEVLANMAIRQQRHFVDTVVMDEFHYYADKERGAAWQIPLLTLADTQFLLMSATLGDVTALRESIKERTGRDVVEVRSVDRPVPLTFSYSEEPLHETIAELLKTGKAPVYLVNFTQRTAAEEAQNLLSVDVCTKDEKETLKASLEGFRFDTPFGKELSRMLRHGVGLHHAGLLPKYRRLVERLAQKGALKVISGTDTLGVGVNVSLRTVLFTQLCKYDGEKTGLLSVRDFQQIAGRAGRKGFDTQGYVVAQAPAHVIENLKLSAKKSAGKKVTLQKAPTKGFVHWDKGTFEKLQARPPEALTSQLTITHGMLVNFLQAGLDTRRGGYAALVDIVRRSHTHEGGKARLLKHAAALFRSLKSAGVVDVEKKTPSMPAHVRISRDMQADFSLHHTLSLYLVDTLPRLDVAAVEYPLDVLSLVESVLESPDVVLYAQLSRIKDAAVADMKGRGVEYAERMEELDKLTWPKPNAEFIYGTFNEFAAKHPWVGQENIRPKSVARELFETAATFNEYVRDLGLQRSEGVLLRYLNEAYKTLLTNVPEGARTEGLEDILAYLEATLRQVDSSLLDEWVAMREGGALPRPPDAPPPRPRVDLALQPAALQKRARAVMHQVTAALSKKRYDEALEVVAPGEWTAKSLEAALEGYWKEHTRIDATPRARTLALTEWLSDGPRRWTVRHTLLDENAEPSWQVLGCVDLTNITGEPDGPLVALIDVRP